MLVLKTEFYHKVVPFLKNYLILSEQNTKDNVIRLQCSLATNTDVARSRHVEALPIGTYTHIHTHTDETSASSDYSQSNQLDKDIDSEIRREAQKVARMVSSDPSLSFEGDTIPLDPNLVCSHCGKQFRLGEIQKFRKHAASCTK